jgi:hypothetical protein
MKPSVLIASGCSWVAGRAIDTDPTSTSFDFNYTEDPKFVEQHSFAGIIQRHLGLDQLLFLATHGSSNEEQLENLINYIDNNLNRYSKVFVLWGITSIYRWQMFSGITNSVQTCSVGRVPDNVELKKEIEYYFSHFWNKETELKKLGKQVVMLDGYLTNLNVDHLFFNSFQSYNVKDLQINNISNQNFYCVKNENNDMLSVLCQHNKIKISKSPWLNVSRSRDSQFNTTSVKELQNIGYLDVATAHPTVKAHKLIANKLVEYIKEKTNERI